MTGPRFPLAASIVSAPLRYCGPDDRSGRQPRRRHEHRIEGRTRSRLRETRIGATSPPKAFSDEADAGSSQKIRQNQGPEELRECSAIVQYSRRSRPESDRCRPVRAARRCHPWTQSRRTRGRGSDRTERSAYPWAYGRESAWMPMAGRNDLRLRSRTSIQPFAWHRRFAVADGFIELWPVRDRRRCVGILDRWSHASIRGHAATA